MSENTKDAVLFDLDGTLIDSFYVYHVAVNHVLSPFGLSCTYDELFKLAGMPGEELYTHFLKKHGKYDFSMKEELKKRFDEKLFEMLREVKFPEKSVDVIIKLKSKGYTMAICTGASRDFVNVVVPDAVQQLLSSIVTCDDVSLCKPDPETFLKAADDIGMDPTNCIVVGDGMNDLIGATRAGMGFVLLRNSRNINIYKGYIKCIDDITDIVSFFFWRRHDQYKHNNSTDR